MLYRNQKRRKERRINSDFLPKSLHIWQLSANFKSQPHIWRRYKQFVMNSNLSITHKTDRPHIQIIFQRSFINKPMWSDQLSGNKQIWRAIDVIPQTFGECSTIQQQQKQGNVYGWMTPHSGCCRCSVELNQTRNHVVIFQTGEALLQEGSIKQPFKIILLNTWTSSDSGHTPKDGKFGPISGWISFNVWSALVKSVLCPSGTESAAVNFRDIQA